MHGNGIPTRTRMKTLDIIIRESREFVCEHWGQGEAGVAFYAPLTRIDGITWIHPAWSKEYTWPEITQRADRVWRISGSFWNPVAFRLIWHNIPELRGSSPAATIAAPSNTPPPLSAAREKDESGTQELRKRQTEEVSEPEMSALSGGGSRSPSAMGGGQP